jgi:2,3,4,5-tetrahydropyridine-2-carboxylate N-succinyltransferase
MNLQEKIELIWEKNDYDADSRAIFDDFLDALNKGTIRSAEKKDGTWKVNAWVKKGILLGFRMGKIVAMGDFFDKDTYPSRRFHIADKIRFVPGGSSVRSGAYLGKNVTLMPPMFINAGAFIDDGTMIDSHALVGSCAQIGKNVHVSAGSQIGGVIEPIGANPVIIEDEVFIGGNCGLYEGVIVKTKAIIAAGVIITGSTPVYDAVNNELLQKTEHNPLIIPEHAVVVAGSRILKQNPNFSVYCPIIIKYRDTKSNTSVQLEKILR